jgi:DNA-binding CsgD family transcriptional regulator
MFDFHASQPIVPPFVEVRLSDTDTAGTDVWRRGVAAGLQSRILQMLDEIDYGMILMSDDLQVLHVNKAAHRDLDEHHPLQLMGNQLGARLTADANALREALVGATERGFRKILRLGEHAERTSVAFVPLVPLDHDDRHAVVLLMERRRVCPDLSVDWFARAHHLTLTESQVLKYLCTGMRPAEVAKRQGVALSTVRSQIGSIRTKTSADSIRELVHQVSVLPPLVSAFQAFERPARHGASALRSN